MLSDLATIPVFTFESIEGYVMDGDSTGGFLYAFLTNDLNGAFRQADGANIRAMETIHMFLYNYAPDDSWGGVEEVRAWKEQGGARAYNGASQEIIQARFDTYRKEHYATA